MHNLDLILTLAGSLAGALGFGIITQRLGLSPIVGYLLAGVAIGPYTPGYVADRPLAEQMAEIGVILLMFGVGLHFQLKELLAVRRVALPGAIAQIIAATLLGASISYLFGWSWSAGMVFGIALSVASTVVLLRVLADNNELHTATGHIAVGWLVVEDLFTVFVLVLLPAFWGTAGVNSTGIVAALGIAAFKIVAFILGVFLLGGRWIPRLLDYAAATRSRELFSLSVLVIALSISVGSAVIFGISMALGAFLAGMIVGKSEFSSRAASEVLPMRDAFAVLFFVSIGMLLNPSVLIQEWRFVVAALIVILLGKPLSAFLIVVLLRYPIKIALAVGIALAQIGEFSFILGALGKELGILPPSALNVLVAASIISITLNPLLFRTLKPFERWLLSTGIGSRLNSYVRDGISSSPSEDSEQLLNRHAIIVGYGPVGETVCRLLRENGVSTAVIELNIETVRTLREKGVAAVYGDAAHSNTLLEARLSHAQALILSAPSMSGSNDIIRLARELNPSIRVLARAAFLKEITELTEAGAEKVFTEEGEVAIAFITEILRELGATPDQIDRERERSHRILAETS